MCACIQAGDCVSFLNVQLPCWCQHCCSFVHLWGIICMYCLLCCTLFAVKNDYVCLPKHFLIVYSLFVWPNPCAPLSCILVCPLNIRLPANQARAHLTVCLPACVCWCVFSSPASQNETSQLNNKPKANRGTPSTSELYPLWSHQSWDKARRYNEIVAVLALCCKIH